MNWKGSACPPQQALHGRVLQEVSVDCLLQLANLGLEEFGLGRMEVGLEPVERRQLFHALQRTWRFTESAENVECL